MATLKAIRKRIGSVRNTQQITKAMKMVSAAKLRRAQEAAVQARPYAEKMTELLKNVAARVASEAHPLLNAARREEDSSGSVYLGPRPMRRLQYQLDPRRGSVHSPASGRPGNRADFSRTQRRRTIFAGAAPRSPTATSIFFTKPADELAAEIAQKLIARFVNGETDAVYILYSRFRSALSQVPTLEKLLPVSLTETSEAEAQQQTEYLYEPGVEQLLASLLPRITDVAVQRALLEATASEHGARMTAMESATGNAAKMIGVVDAANEPGAPGVDYSRAVGNRRHGGSIEVIKSCS